MQKKRLSGKRILLLTATALVLILIFLQSMLPRSISTRESQGVLDRIVNPILRALGLRPLTHNGARKIAHVVEFSILAVLLVLCWRGSVTKGFFTGFAAAFLDESIQLFSDRGAEIRDVWIDLIGVASGVLIGFLSWRWYTIRGPRVEENDT